MLNSVSVPSLITSRRKAGTKPLVSGYLVQGLLQGVYQLDSGIKVTFMQLKWFLCGRVLGLVPECVSGTKVMLLKSCEVPVFVPG